MRLKTKAFRYAAAGIALAGIAAVIPAATASAASHAAPKPTIVLVHGAWADSASWGNVAGELIDAGYTVDVVPNPLRSVKDDSAYVADYLTSITGPIVLVGHSYGGFVISKAAVGNTNVKALVYVDGFIPAEGESAGSLTALNPGSQVEAAVTTVASSGGAVVDTYIQQALFPGIFANDESKKAGALLATEQRPLTFSALTEVTTGAQAWTTIPSWAVVGTVDNVIPPATQTFMAKRAGAHITTIKAAHLSMVSHPDQVTCVIESAAKATA
jgi:pimeloyl-ACP methyl ester carboxylesterase